jgi:3-hydroxyacyl-[acyl-carrier-protein] dehydratase
MLDIPSLLPHRYPFLLVDRVVAFEPGVSITAYKNVSFNEPMFEGHFPGEPIFPGVLIIEAMAQVAGLMGSHHAKTNWVEVDDDTLYLFVGADKIRFKRPVVPGDRLTMQAKVMSAKRKIWKFDCTAHVEDEFVCSAQILCALRTKPH